MRDRLVNDRVNAYVRVQAHWVFLKTMPSNHVTCIDDVVANYDNIIFDCDGVIWQGGHLIPGVDKCLKALNDAGKEVRIVRGLTTGR